MSSEITTSPRSGPFPGGSESGNESTSVAASFPRHSPVESADAAVADEQDGDLRLFAPERGEERGGAAAQAAGGGAPARVLRGEADGHGLARSWMAGGGGASSPARGGYAGRV